MALRDKIRIMVVDDMAASRGLITMGLDKLGIQHYDYVKDGETALRTLTSRPCHLVISDYEMPKMDGLQLLQGLRNHEKTRSIGFILISGRATGEILAKGKSLGMNNFLKKPFTPQDLGGAIEAVYGRL